MIPNLLALIKSPLNSLHKWGAPVLVPIFTAIFNKCLIKGVYPDSLKVARVTPVFKGGNKNSTTSYRPISILTQLNRVLEKILCDRLYAFMKPKLYVKQFGFQPQNSTEHPILDLKENILFNQLQQKINKLHTLPRSKESIRLCFSWNSYWKIGILWNQRSTSTTFSVIPI